ncbi:unnamed protein product [Rotaria sordida]|uniref:GCF C-terminal domain-containing protein n=1 Tax=Rotaria sordida TaxID=392033 RepID=A0A815JP98_9BILA|nr:unnamed protein product [Rotaria sordida]
MEDEQNNLKNNIQDEPLANEVRTKEGEDKLYTDDNEDSTCVMLSKTSECKESTNISTINVVVGNPSQCKEEEEKETCEDKVVYKTIHDTSKEGPTESGGKQFDNVIREQAKIKQIHHSSRGKSVHETGKLLTTENNCIVNNIKKLTSHDVVSMTDLLIISSEQAITRSHEREKFGADKLIALREELTNTKEEINKSNQLLYMLDECEKMSKHIKNLSDLSSFQNLFEILKEDFPKEYREYNLGGLAVPILYCFMKQYISSNWNIIADNDNCSLRNCFLAWKSILEADTYDLELHSKTPSEEYINPYDNLILDVWMPALRESIREWNPHQSYHLINCIERWKVCLTERLLDNIFDQLIFPKINHEVDAWNSSIDSTAIYELLNVWKPLMENRLEPLYESIRRRSDNRVNHYLIDDTSYYLIKEVVTWDNDNYIAFNVSFYELKPTIHLDIFLPRILNLALHNSDRQTKVLAYMNYFNQ